MNGWVSKWAKSNYPTAKSDLCTCFFERGRVLAEAIGYISMITASSWMFISSFEKFRRNLLSHGSICSMIQQSTHGYAGVTVPTTMFVYACNRSGVIGSYIRLEDFDRPQWQEPRALEALANPDCGWFYRADASGFEAIPGSPIAYWASEAAITAFNSGPMFGELANPSAGITTGDNASFIHYWWEQGIHDISFTTVDFANRPNDRRWFPCNKGGSFRKWYGNRDNIMAFDDSSIEKMRHLAGYRPVNIERQFKSSISWSDITSGINSFRANGAYSLYDHVGISAFPNESSFSYLLALLNSSVTSYYLVLIAPTLHCNAGDIAKLPVLGARKQHVIDAMAADCVELSKIDWNAFETSWEFRKHPLV